MSNRWIGKDVVRTYWGILFNHKKEWNNGICGNMHGPRDHHPEWSEPGKKDKYHDKCLYVESKKMVQMNLFTKQK